MTSPIEGDDVPADPPEHIKRLAVAILNAPDVGVIGLFAETLDRLEIDVVDPLRELFRDHLALSRYQLSGTIAGRRMCLGVYRDSKAEGKVRGINFSLVYLDNPWRCPDGLQRALRTRLTIPGAVRLTSEDDPLADLAATKGSPEP